MISHTVISRAVTHALVVAIRSNVMMTGENVKFRSLRLAGKTNSAYFSGFIILVGERVKIGGAYYLCVV
jgi:hypothetical protein